MHRSEDGDHYQVDYITQEPQTILANGDASLFSHAFAGAKIQCGCSIAISPEYHIPNFDKAVDFGWFYFLTKPIFYCLDWLNGLLGNSNGLAIMAFTVLVKALFSSRWRTTRIAQMSKMKLLAPKMQACCASGSWTSRSACSKR